MFDLGFSVSRLQMKMKADSTACVQAMTLLPAVGSGESSQQVVARFISFMV